MHRLVFGAVMLVCLAHRTHAAEAKSPAIQVARKFARETIDAMKHGDDAVSGPVVQHKVVRRAAPPADLAVLRGALEDPQLDIFSISASAFTLGAASQPDVDRAVATLIRQMNRAMFAQPHVQHKLLVALGSRAVPELVRHLSNSMVVAVLRDMGPEARSAVPALKAALGSRNVEVAAALVEIGSDDALAAAIPVLVRVADDPFDPWAKHAAIALGRSRRTSAAAAIPSLRRLLSSRDPDTRVYAAAALARLGDASTAARALGSIVRSKAVDDPHRALSALRSMGNQAAPARDDLIAYLQDQDQEAEKRAGVALTLVRIAPTDAKVLGALKTAATDPSLARVLSAEVRAAVAK